MALDALDMIGVLTVLALAAGLELGGDALIRIGLLDSAWRWVALGGLMLFAYGLTVNVYRKVDFGQLMGVYIAVFFVVSQLLSIGLFKERPSLSLVFGGALIVTGGLVIQLAGR